MKPWQRAFMLVEWIFLWAISAINGWNTYQLAYFGFNAHADVFAPWSALFGMVTFLVGCIILWYVIQDKPIDRKEKL